MRPQERAWVLFKENRKKVVASLKEGRCDGIIPAAIGFLDGFVGFLDRSGLLSLFDRFSDNRKRRSIAPFFFCHAMVHRPLFRLSRLAHIGETLFRSPYILRLLGFTARQIDEGFYETSGEKPFDPEALGEFFALARDEDFFAHQVEWLRAIQRVWPEVFRHGLWVMDGLRFTVSPGGHGVPAGDYKICVLGIWQDGEVWPLLWRFADGTASDLTLGKEVLASALEVLSEGTLRHLVMDAGFVDGEWAGQLWKSGVKVTLRIRSNMDLFSDLQGLARMEPNQWEQVALPKRPKKASLPLRREIVGFSGLESWSSCDAPLCGCLIRDTYADGVRYHALVQTVKEADAQAIYAAYRKRWDIEETFMAWTRYWRMEDLPPARRGITLAMVHFALLAFTLLAIYLAISGSDRRPWSPPRHLLPERELAVYAGRFYTLLLPSELMAIVLENDEAWRKNKDKLLRALQMAEGKPTDS